MELKKMKAFNLSLWMTLILSMTVVGDAWGSGHSFYTRLNLSLKSGSSGYGKVYASSSNEDNVADNKFANSSQATSDNQGQSGGSPTMYLYARECRGGKFTGWTSSDITLGGEASKLNTSAALASPYAQNNSVKNQSAEDGKKHYKDYTATATFVANTTYVDVPFLAPSDETKAACKYTIQSNMLAGASPYNTLSWAVQNSGQTIRMFDNEAFKMTASVTQRGYGFVQWYAEVGGEKAVIPGKVDINPATVTYMEMSQFVNAGGSVGAEFRKKASANISYLAVEQVNSVTPGSYTASGADANGVSYPAITIGGDAVTTYEDDQITLSANNNSGYALYRYFYVDQNGNRRLLGELFTKTQTVTIPMDAQAVGAEFIEMRYADITYQVATGGTYKVDGKTTDQADMSFTVTTVAQTKNTLVSSPVTLTATPASGKMLYRWYAEDENGIKVTIGEFFTTPQSVGIPQTAVKVGAEFVDIQPFMVVGEGIYGNLSDALQAASTSASKLIKVIKDATVPSGYYTIPSDITLLIPYTGQTAPHQTIERIDGTAGTTTPSKAVKLTLANGVHLDVLGTIEAGGKQASGAQGAQGAGIPKNSYGQLDLQEGSEIVLSGVNAKLRAWGFVTGAGKIDVRRGATVYEQFQIMDWKGGTILTGGAAALWAQKLLGNDYQVFPVNQYYIQNVEAAAKFHPGSSLIAATSVYVSSTTVAADNVKIIGVDGEIAMFLMDQEDDSEDTWVCKSYDAVNDLQVYEINSSARLGSMLISISGYVMNSTDYVLPLTNNMKIHLKSGELRITQSTVMLPGSEIEIDKTATVAINAGQALYLYDKDQWGRYVYSNLYGQQVLYTPSANGKPNKRAYALSTTASNATLNDATLNVHGTFEVEGALYTTSSGANIYSSIEDAGTVTFTAPAAANGTVYQAYNFVTDEFLSVPYLSSYDHPGESCPSAKLKNDAGSTYSGGDGFSETAGTPVGKSFCFMDVDNDGNGEWVSLTVDEDDPCFVYDQYHTYYAKPGAYVAINAEKDANDFIVGNDDHTYSDAAGTGRLFILMPDCQWWEVELRDNLYYCSDNNTYYYYDEDNGWTEKKFSIVWKNYNGSTIATYPLTYGTTPVYLGSTPTRPEDIDSTYAFKGWKPAVQSVTGDAVYTADFASTQKKYTIRFLNEDGGEIERQQLARGAMPSCSSAPQKAGKYLVWYPTIAAVTGNIDYLATYLDEEPDEFTITWNNYDGTEIYHEQVAKNAIPAYSKTTAIGHTGVDAEGTPVKDLGNEYNYTFTGWSPAVVAATQNAAYTAVFTDAKKTGTITFYKEDGSTIIGAPQNVEYGKMPVAPNYEKEDPVAGHIYTLVWSPTIQSVMGNAYYTATFTDEIQKITISAETSIPNSGVVTGAGTYDYDAAADAVTLNVIPNLGYEFVKWQIWDGEKYVDGASTQSFTTSATASTTYKAVIKEQDLVVGLNEAVEIKKPTTVPNLILQASENQSGQLLPTNNLTVTGNAYFDLKLNTDARHWHAFGVPWNVDVTEYPAIELETGRTLTIGRDYEIVSYNGATRASQGAGAHCWDYLKHYNEAGQPVDVMTPGKGYMIALTRAIGTVRFTKATGAPIFFTGSNSVTGGAGEDGGWNAIANPMAYHATLNAGPTVGYVHDGGEIGSDGYTPYDISGTRYIVGKMVYVQAGADQAIVVNPAGSAGEMTVVSAPKRRAKATDKQYISLSDYYTVALTNADGVGSKVYILPEEDKANEYVIGHDLSQFSMSNKKAQIWVNCYDTKLALNTMAPIADVAEFPVTLYAPVAGEYTITNTFVPDDEYIVYLTLDGEAIWNLSDAAYTITLDKGTVNNYGLRLNARKAPSVATGIDEAVVDAKGETRKVMINDQVYIIRGENVYSVDGQLVK